MTEEYILHKDVITNHKDRMFYLRKYFPYFKITENNFSQFQNGKYESLDMGYLLMAVLRFFIEENNFREKDVTYQEYSSFIKEIYERDFGLVLDQAEEQSLSSYIFDKITNEGRPFLWSYYDPVEKKKETLRVRLLDSRVTKEGVYYRLTSEAIEFYLDTKEIQDESDISVSQVLLSKMIASRNFRGGIQVVQRMNNQVARLQKQREEVLGLLAGDVFHGIQAYEKFMENGTKWFAEEQKMFHKNMELIEEALKRADTEAAYGQAVKDIYDLESELKRALINHSRLLSDCTKLQIQADEMVDGAKYSRLNWIHRYHLLLESVLIAPAGQFVHMDENQKPVYTEEVNQQYTPQIQKIQEGIRQYVEDFYGLCGEKALQAELEKTFMEELIHAAVKCGIADKKLEDSFVVEDTYCSDSRLNAMEHYREIEESREEQ